MSESWQELLQEGLASGFPSDELIEHMDDILVWVPRLGEAGGQLESELIVEFGDIEQVRRNVVTILDRLLFVTPTSDKTLFGRAALRNTEALKRRYIRLMGVFHPDRGYHDAGWLTARSEIINTRYKVLQKTVPTGDTMYSNGEQREASIGAAVTTKPRRASAVNSDARLAFLGALRKHLPESPQKLQRMVLVGLVTLSVLVVGLVYQRNRSFDMPVELVDNQASGIGDQGSGFEEQGTGNRKQEAVLSEEAVKTEAERVAAVEAAKKEMNLRATEEAARVEAARVEAERVATMQAAKIEAERLAAAEEAARVETERVAAMEAARKETGRVAAAEEAKKDAQRIASVAEAGRVEAARVEAARVEAERVAAAEVARLEAERIAAAAAAKVEADQIAANQEATRVAAAKLEAERVEQERLATEQAAVRLGEEQLRFEIMTLMEGLRKAYNAGDADRYAAFFAVDGSDSDMQGRAEISRRYRDFFSGTNARSWSAEIHDVIFKSPGASEVAGTLRIHLQQDRRKQFNRSYSFSLSVEKVADAMQITRFEYEEQ